MESFQVLGVSSLGVWLGDREGEMGWGVNELVSGDKKFGSPGAGAPRIAKHSFVGVDELVKSAGSKISARDCLESNFVKFNFDLLFRDVKPG